MITGILCVITTIKLIDVTISITSDSPHLFQSVVRTFKIDLLSKFQVHNTILLTIVTVLYISSPELIHFA